MTDTYQPVIRCFAFGGVGEFGKNMMVYAVDDDAIILDVGMGFPEPGHHGINITIPDISSLDELGLKIHGIVLTHGHEDHIGALPFLLPRLKLPVWGTPITLALVKNKLAEVNYKADLHHLPEDGTLTQVGTFEVEAIPVTHSIMDAVSVAIHTPLGVIIHTGDFKFDPSPLDGRSTELHRFASLGDKGVLLLCSDSTNAPRSGSSPSEISVGGPLKQAISQCKGKVIVSTFSSNMFRIQLIIDAALATGRKIAFAGRSLEKNVEISKMMGRLTLPDSQVVDVRKTAGIPDRELLVIATGSQGEWRAALSRIAQDHFKNLHLAEGDLVIFSSSSIPGNERVIAGLFNHIYRRGARILHAGQAHLHVSGHAQAHELKTMIQLTRPKYMYPVHGEYRNLVEHQHLAVATNVPFENTIIAENGQSVVVTAEKIEHGPKFHAGAVFVDDSGRDEVDYAVIKDRRALADEGMITAIVLIDQHEGHVIGEPELVTRGVLRSEVSEETFDEAAKELRVHLESFNQETLADIDAAREEVRIWVRRWCKRKLSRRPMVVTTIIEV
ncbi:MAG: ribonuclease J [Mariprofundaceae bacterium]|nr:ribonuclease J [Mariprofundaceae bacterium]